MECHHLNFIFKNGENGQGCRKWVWRARYKQIVHSIWVFFPLDQNTDYSNKLHRKLFMTQHLIMWIWMVDMLSQASLLIYMLIVLIIITLLIQLSTNLTLKFSLIICLILMLLKMLPNLPLQLLTMPSCVQSILLCDQFEFEFLVDTMQPWHVFLVVGGVDPNSPSSFVVCVLQMLLSYLLLTICFLFYMHFGIVLSFACYFCISSMEAFFFGEKP